MCDSAHFRFSLIFLCSLLFFLSSCIPHKKYIDLPSEGFQLSSELLKTNGYFYLEEERIDYCQSVISGSGYARVKASEYLEKRIKVLALGSRGEAYHSGGRFFSGIDRNIGNGMDFCNQLENNTYDAARKNYEEAAKGGLPDPKNKGLYNRGIYTLEGNQIQIQVYHTGAPELILTTYQGMILNDSTIHLTSRRSHSNEAFTIDQTYRFKQYGAGPNESNYILEHRKKFGD